MIEPLRLSVDLDCAADHAFDVWTRRLSMWWPKDHSVSGDPETEIHLEPWVYGRIFERTPDGTEHDWGRINRWDPPSHLGYQWHIGRDADAATDVELTFVALDEDRTRLEVVHSGWERLGREAQDWRNANSAGWEATLPAYRTAVIEIQSRRGSPRNPLPS